MSGHNKWSSIKHKKGAADAKRGQVFTKVIKEITVAAREGGGSLETNSRLRAAVAKAKEANMPSDNVKMAIKRGTGELPGVTYETMMYEGYGPNGVAIMIEAVTDNKNRTTAEIRNIMSKKGGNIAGSGSVAWIFSKKGLIILDKNSIKEDELMNIVLDAGAEDVQSDAKNYEVMIPPQDYEKVKTALQDKGIKWETAELTMEPSSKVKLESSEAKQVLNLVEALEEHEDVQEVYANFDIPDEILEQIANEQEE